MPKPVQEAFAVLKNAQAEINQLLSDPLYVHKRLEMNTLFRRIEFQLKAIGAVVEPDQVTEKKLKFPPITNFMGEEIVIQDVIRPEDYTPDSDRKRKFRARVQKLHDEFIELGADRILKNYIIPEDQTVVRGVAMRAGFERSEVEHRELTVEFMEEIIARIKDNAEIKAGLAKVNDEIKNQTQLKQLAEHNDDDDDKPITQEDIDADQSMLSVNAIPGDKLSDVTAAIIDGKKLRSDKDRASMVKQPKVVLAK